MATKKIKKEIINGVVYRGTPAYIAQVKRTLAWNKKVKDYKAQMRKKYGLNWTKDNLTKAEDKKMSTLLRKQSDAAMKALKLAYYNPYATK